MTPFVALTIACVLAFGSGMAWMGIKNAKRASITQCVLGIAGVIVYFTGNAKDASSSMQMPPSYLLMIGCYALGFIMAILVRSERDE